MAVADDVSFSWWTFGKSGSCERRQQRFVMDAILVAQPAD
jgi:hypothetical protein